MKKIISLILSIFMLSMCIGFSASSADEEEIAKNKELITQIKNSTSADEKTNEIFVKAILPDTTEQILETALKDFDYTIVKQYSLSGAYLVSFNSVSEADRAIDILNARGDIKYAEPNYCISLSIPEIPSDINAISTPSDWAKESIDKAQALNISEASRVYDYTNPITREEFCELIYNYVKLLGKLDGKTTETKFTDSSNEKVIVLSNMGIIEGKSETEFAPLDTLTREEAATILARVAYSVFDGPAVTSNRITFADYSEMSDWARNHIQNIYKWGIMKGVGTATENNIPVFAPKDTLTSEQAIATIVRMYEKNPVSEPVVKFVDSAGNIIISDKDIISCEIEYNKISQSLPEEPYIHFVITDEARAVFKEATARISDYSENYIHIIINAETVSSPIVAAEIDSSDILLKISDGRDLDSLIKIINDAIK